MTDIDHDIAEVKRWLREPDHSDDFNLERMAEWINERPVGLILAFLDRLVVMQAGLDLARPENCNCPLPYRVMVPEAHHETCPALNNPLNSPERVDLYGGESWPNGVSDGLVSPCSRCGETPKFDYKMSDDLWREIVPEDERRGVICLPCLDRIAAAKGIDYADDLQHVQFTATGQTFVLKPVTVYEYPPKELHHDD